jgi:predicted Zn-dependent protease
MNTKVVKVSGFGFLALMIACATSPLGRKQIVLLSAGKMNQMGAQSFEELKAKTPIERDPKINQYVQCVVSPILEVSKGRAGVDRWEVVVFKDPSANAFALPGGKIGVHTGILPVAKTPAQLAAVLGHEVGHVMAQHGNERVSQGQLASILLGAANIAVKDMDASKKQLLMAGLGVGMQFGALLPFSRTQESEADLIGLELMAKAGFDPAQSVELWKNMSAASGGRSQPEWMSTHPSSQSRIANLEAHVPARIPDYQNALNRGAVPRCKLN